MDASRDNNNIPSKLACLNTDTVQGTNLVRIAINGNNGGIKVNTTTSTTISFTMKSIDPRDSNYVGCWLFQGTDNLTYPAVATAAGELLIDL